MSVSVFKKALKATMAFVAISSLSIMYAPPAYSEIIIKESTENSDEWTITFTKDEIPLYFGGTERNQKYIKILQGTVAKTLETYGVDKETAEKAAKSVDNSVFLSDIQTQIKDGIYTVKTTKKDIVSVEELKKRTDEFYSTYAASIVEKKYVERFVSAIKKKNKSFGIESFSGYLTTIDLFVAVDEAIKNSEEVSKKFEEKYPEFSLEEYVNALLVGLNDDYFDDQGMSIGIALMQETLPWYNLTAEKANLPNRIDDKDIEFFTGIYSFPLEPLIGKHPGSSFRALGSS